MNHSDIPRKFMNIPILCYYSENVNKSYNNFFVKLRKIWNFLRKHLTKLWGTFKEMLEEILEKSKNVLVHVLGRFWRNLHIFSIYKGCLKSKFSYFFSSSLCEPINVKFQGDIIFEFLATLWKLRSNRLQKCTKLSIENGSAIEVNAVIHFFTAQNKSVVEICREV